MSLYRQPGMLMFWTHDAIAPWQTPEWLAQMREQLRPNAYLRMIENRFVSSESSFVDPEQWDACVDGELRPALANPRIPVWGGLDASVKKDSTAIVLCGWNEPLKKVRLVWHRIFQPSRENPLDFEATIEATLLELNRAFDLREVRFDPYQLVAVSQRLTRAGVRMVEFPQSVPNLTEASQNLFDLIKGRNIEAYPDPEIRLAITRAVAKETPRGWRIAKEKTSHKIDVVVAMAQAALGATKNNGAMLYGLLEWWKQQEQVKPKPPQTAPTPTAATQAEVERCPACGATTIARIGGNSKRCSSCGAQWPKPAVFVGFNRKNLTVNQF